MKTIPLHSLVILIGPTGAGKSYLAQRKFSSYEIVSIDQIRYELLGEEQRTTNNQQVWSEVYHRVNLKLGLGGRVVVDSSNLQSNDRINLAQLGLNHKVPVYYVVVDRPDDVKRKCGAWRVGIETIYRRQVEQFEQGLSSIMRGDSVAEVIDSRREDFDVVDRLGSDPLSCIRSRGYTGILAMGDVHGCPEALRQAVTWGTVRNRFIVFLGDIVDYGPNSLECVEEAYRVVVRGQGCLIIGNHERKIERWLEQVKQDRVRVRLSEGNQVTTNAIESLSTNERKTFEMRFRTLLNLGRHHLVIGNTMFAHAAADPKMWHIAADRLMDRELESRALFGQVEPQEGKNDKGYPNRIYDWVDEIPNGKMVLVGHDIRQTAMPLEQVGHLGGRAIFMDTGSGKGGHLSSADLAFAKDGLRLTSYVSH